MNNTEYFLAVTPLFKLASRGNVTSQLLTHSTDVYHGGIRQYFPYLEYHPTGAHQVAPAPQRYHSFCVEILKLITRFEVELACGFGKKEHMNNKVEPCMVQYQRWGKLCSELMMEHF